MQNSKKLKLKGAMLLKKFNTITGEELLEKELQQIPFVVEGLIPIGLSILAGAPKVGKSWLSLWLSLQVAKGEKIWNNEVSNGTSLYLCFEDNEIRIQNRLLDVTEDAPNSVHFCTEISRLGGELETRIENFVKEHDDTKLIIIDTLQTIRMPGTDSNYANDYSDLMALKKLADDNKVAILLIHHFRKTKEKDVFNQITGSTGLQGAVDTMFVLTQSARGEKAAILKCIGRDIEPREIEIERTEDNLWILIEDSLEESSLADKKFVELVKNFMVGTAYYKGTATDLSTLLSQNRVDKITNKTITKNLKRLSMKLESVGISIKLRKSNGVKYIEIYSNRVDRVVKNKPLKLSTLSTLSSESEVVL